MAIGSAVMGSRETGPCAEIIVVHGSINDAGLFLSARLVRVSSVSIIIFCVFFFFQAEDGIRDLYVTGVQTCALPISITKDPDLVWIPSRWRPTAGRSLASFQGALKYRIPARG